MADQAGTEGGSKSAPVVIKKYANRRLYNTSTSAYVTLDRSYPKDRLRYIIEDSRLAFVVTHGDTEAALPSGVGSVVHLDTDRQMLEQLGDDNLELEVDAHHLAYVV